MLPLAAGADELQRTIDLGAPVEVQLHYADASPGSSALAGEGSVSTALPGEGQVTLRLPHVVGQSVALGNAQVAARYDLVRERQLLPSFGLVAHVDLPTATGSREAQPRLKATLAKNVGSGFIEAIRLDGEVWADGLGVAPGYRASVGTTLRLLPATNARVELVSLRHGIAAGFARESLAQLGLSHRLGASTGLHAGIAARVAGDARSIQATIGFDRRF